MSGNNRKQSLHHQDDDELLMEFVLNPEGGGGNILKTPLRVNVEELARTGGYTTINTTGPDGRPRQATLIMQDEATAPSSSSQTRGAPGAASNNNQQSQREHDAIARAAQKDPSNAHAMTSIRREEQLDAVEGRRSFVAADLEELELSAHQAAANKGGSNRKAASSSKASGQQQQQQPAAPIIKRHQKLKSCAADNIRSFGPPPIRRFAATGYTNAVVGGDGVRRLLVAGGLSKVSVEHEVYEYSLSGQRWRRLECRAEQHTPAGLPIMPLARHSHSASVLLEAGQGGQPFLIIYGGVGLGGCVVPPDGLQTRQSRAIFEELFGCDADTFARSNQARIASSSMSSSRGPMMQTQSVLDIIQGGDDGSGVAATNAIATSGHSGAVAQVGVLDEIHELNLKTRAWRRVQVASGSHQPKHLCEHTAVMFGNRAVIFGGTTLEMTPAEGKYLHFIEAVRAKTHSGARTRSYAYSTRVLEPAPLGRTRHSAVACAPDVMAIFGGLSAAGDFLGDLWLLNGAATCEEPVWVNVPLVASASSGSASASGKASTTSPSQKGSFNEGLAASSSGVGGAGGGQMPGRSGHACCMSHSHRMLVVGGQTDRGLTSSVLEIQLGPVLLDGAAEAVCRTVKVDGDALPRFAFGVASSAGDGCSAVVFGGQKTWKEDVKKLKMLKNPTPQEIARARRKAKDHEGLSNSVFVFTYPEIAPPPGGWPAPKGSGESDDGSGGDDDDESGTATSASRPHLHAGTGEDGAWHPKEPHVPASFTATVNKMLESYKYQWEKVTEQQHKIDDDAKVFAAARVFVSRAKAEEIVGEMNDALEWFSTLKDGDFPEGLDQVDARKKARDNDLRTGLSQAKMQCGLYLGDAPGKGKKMQQLNYLPVEEHVKKCHKGIAELRRCIDMSTSRPEAVAWQKGEHTDWLDECVVKLRSIERAIRDAKKAVVDATLKRLAEAEQRSRNVHRELRLKAEKEERELLTKTAMEFVLEERRAAGPRTRGQIRAPPKKQKKSEHDDDAKNNNNNNNDEDDADRYNEDGTRKKKNINKFRYHKLKKVQTYPTPAYGEQIPDLEIALIENDYKVHARLVRVCRNEITNLESEIAKIPDEVRHAGGSASAPAEAPADGQPQQQQSKPQQQSAYDVVVSAIADFDRQLNAVEAVITHPAAAGTKTTTTTNTTGTSFDSSSSSSSSASSVANGAAPAPAAAAAATAASDAAAKPSTAAPAARTTSPNKKGAATTHHPADGEQTIKSLVMLRRSKDLVDLAKQLKAKAADAAQPHKMGKPLVERIKSCIENLDHVSRAFRQYWHLTFLSRGYEHGGSGVDHVTQLERARSRSPRGGVAAGSSNKTGNAATSAPGTSGRPTSARPGSAARRSTSRTRAPSAGRSSSVLRAAAAGGAGGSGRTSSTGRPRPRNSTPQPAPHAVTAKSLPPRPASQQQMVGPSPSSSASAHQVRIAALPPGYALEQQQQQQHQRGYQQQQHSQHAFGSAGGQIVQFAAINSALLRTGVADGATTAVSAAADGGAAAAAANSDASDGVGWSIVSAGGSNGAGGNQQSQQQQQQHLATTSGGGIPSLSTTAQMHWIQASSGAVSSAAAPSFGAAQPMLVPAAAATASPMQHTQPAAVARTTPAPTGGVRGASTGSAASRGALSNAASVNSNNDPLFKGKKLTPGEKKILEARSNTAKK